MLRTTVNIPGASREATFLAELRQGSSEARQLLADLVPEETLASDSSIIRALMIVAHRALSEQTMSLQYDRAITDGIFDGEAQAWARDTRRTTAGVWSEG
ncbi:MAG: hypothetical protein ACRDY7_14135 [Acidimicrobiia bacterium]